MHCFLLRHKTIWTPWWTLIVLGTKGYEKVILYNYYIIYLVQKLLQRICPHIWLEKTRTITTNLWAWSSLSNAININILPFFPFAPLIFFFYKEHTFHIYTKKWETRILKLNNKSIGHCCQNCESVQTCATPPPMQKACDDIKGHTKVRCAQSKLPAERKWTWLWALIQLFPSHGPWCVIYHGLSLWSIDRLSFDQSQQDREDHSLLLRTEIWLAAHTHPSSPPSSVSVSFAGSSPSLSCSSS